MGRKNFAYNEVIEKMARSGNFRVTEDGRVQTNMRYRGGHDHDYVPCDWRYCDPFDGKGYRYVSHKNSRPKAHRIAYRLHHGDMDYDMEINHRDGDGLNNRRNNLELVGPSEQSKHAFDIGLNLAKGENHRLAKLTEDGVRYARKEYAAGRKIQRELAEELGVSQIAIGMMLRRRTWRHVK